MNVVWVLIALTNNGHFNHTVVPTLEFKTQEACVRAVVAFEQETNGKRGSAAMRCVMIEK